MYNNIVVITGELLQACWSEKVLLPSNKSHFEFGSEMARHRRQIVLGKPKVSSGQQLLYLINDFRGLRTSAQPSDIEELILPGD
jgi:hypothetical protein